MAVLPAVVIQEVEVGSSFAGVAPNGAPQEEQGGRIVRYLGCTAAGLWLSPQTLGLRLCAVSVNLNSPGVTVDLRLVEPDGFFYMFKTFSNVETYLFNDSMILIPPGWSLQMVSSGPMAGPSKGRIMIVLDKGLAAFPLTQFAS